MSEDQKTGTPQHATAQMVPGMAGRSTPLTPAAPHAIAKQEPPAGAVMACPRCTKPMRYLNHVKTHVCDACGFTSADAAFAQS